MESVTLLSSMMFWALRRAVVSFVLMREVQVATKKTDRIIHMEMHALARRLFGVMSARGVY